MAEERMAMLPFAATLPVRTPLLAADLATLGLAMPDRLSLAKGDADAAAWGALYVVEGSRLGGAMLARQVPAGWPSAYLSAVHPPGGWRAIRAAIDHAAAGKDDRWIKALVTGARETFALYARAAA
jgi:heme oxygenase